MPTKMWATIKFDQTLREREKERERERGISPDLVVVTSERLRSWEGQKEEEGESTYRIRGDL